MAVAFASAGISATDAHAELTDTKDTTVQEDTVEAAIPPVGVAIAGAAVVTAVGYTAKAVFELGTYVGEWLIGEEPAPDDSGTKTLSTSDAEKLLN